MAVVDRFWSNVTIDPDGCWTWNSFRDRDGYGQFNGLAGSSRRAHKIAYELENGPVPEGLVLDHLCHDTQLCNLGAQCPHRACVRPSHLKPVTMKENAARTLKANQTHCLNGHEFTDENTHIRVNGTRTCRTCHRENEKAPENLVRRAEAQRRNRLKNGEKRSPEALARRREKCRERYRRRRDEGQQAA